MTEIETQALTTKILKKAKDFGASLVGITSVAALKTAPSFTVTPKMPTYQGVGSGEKKSQNTSEVAWPEEAKSVIVVAYVHPEEQPELDYWYDNISPLGNKKLIEIVDKLCQWLKTEYALNPVHLKYHINNGGIFLKDAAVLAGLGCIGKNNLLLTPEYGSRVRLRALTIDLVLPSTGPLQFDPCGNCDERCNRSCPQQAFAKFLYTPAEYGRNELPGRKGNYSRIACNVQMGIDEALGQPEMVADYERVMKVIKYCRQCECNCPVGK